jgi:acylphosphatase
LGLVGTAKNLPDGSVELIAKGPEDKIERLVKWCHKGPEGAQVTSVDVEDMPVDPDLGKIE